MHKALQEYLDRHQSQQRDLSPHPTDVAETITHPDPLDEIVQADMRIQQSNQVPDASVPPHTAKDTTTVNRSATDIPRMPGMSPHSLSQSKTTGTTSAEVRRTTPQMLGPRRTISKDIRTVPVRKTKRQMWTEGEDAIIFSIVKSNPAEEPSRIVGLIADRMKGSRTRQQCRNHFNVLIRKGQIWRYPLNPKKWVIA